MRQFQSPLIYVLLAAAAIALALGEVSDAGFIGIETRNHTELGFALRNQGGDVAIQVAQSQRGIRAAIQHSTLVSSLVCAGEALSEWMGIFFR